MDQTKPQCDKDQYNMLLECSKENNLTRWENYLKLYKDAKILLEGANFNGARLNGVVLNNAYLKWADFSGAHLNNAEVSEAHLNGADLSDAHLNGADLSGTHLDGANLSRAHLRNKANLSGAYLIDANLYASRLEKAELNNAHLEGANLIEAYLNSAILNGAHLNGAKLHGTYLKEAELKNAHIEAAEFKNAHLEGADFEYAIVNEETWIKSHYFDKKTFFVGVGLDSARVEPRLKEALKNNIRREYWERWMKEQRNKGKRCRLLFAKCFWCVTDYGSSTKKIINVFLFLTFFFGILYWLIAYIPALFFCDWEGIIKGLRQGDGLIGVIQTFFRSIYFSFVTMTTLGFGDMCASERGFLASLLGNISLSIQVLSGYVLLGALITRLGILFTSEAPAANPKLDEESNDE